jgi:hypothetical protein
MKMGQFCFWEGWVSTHRMTQMISPAAAVKISLQVYEILAEI